MQRISLPSAGYSADTEILTRRGWVTFDQLTYLDQVATRSPQGEFGWEHPRSIRWQRCRGEMVSFRSRTTDLMVGPDTPILHTFNPRATDASGKRYDLPVIERTRPAGSLLAWRKGSLVATSTWNPVSPKTEFTLKPTRHIPPGWKRPQGKPPLSFTATAADFAAFMGMYLSEGNLNTWGDHYYRIDIWQKTHGKGFAEFQELLNRLLGREIRWLKSGQWGFLNKALYEYLKPCGGYAWTKTIPRDVLDLDAASLEQFWRYYWLGDGTLMNTGANRRPLDVISTTSPVMAGQFQEILQKLGGWALIQVIDFSKYKSKLGKTCHLTYRLVRRAGTTACPTGIERVPYDGMVGFAETGTGPVYTRRNYRPVWSGA